jgi:hypothetical protein
MRCDAMAESDSQGKNTGEFCCFDRFGKEKQLQLYNYTCIHIVHLVVLLSRSTGGGGLVVTRRSSSQLGRPALCGNEDPSWKIVSHPPRWSTLARGHPPSVTDLSNTPTPPIDLNLITYPVYDFIIHLIPRPPFLRLNRVPQHTLSFIPTLLSHKLLISPQTTLSPSPCPSQLIRPKTRETDPTTLDSPRPPTSWVDLLLAAARAGARERD